MRDIGDTVAPKLWVLFREKSVFLQFVAFLERLSRTLNMDELTQDIGIELHTESIIHRAEQLARLESDKIVDKVSVSRGSNN